MKLSCLFSSPEPKILGELLVSEGDDPSSVVRGHVASTLDKSSETTESDLPQIWLEASLCQSHLNLILLY